MPFAIRFSAVTGPFCRLSDSMSIVAAYPGIHYVRRQLVVPAIAKGTRSYLPLRV